MKQASVIHKIAAIAMAMLLPFSAQAGLIRDAEVEATLRADLAPILESAGIPNDDVRILIVNDPTLNAFVAGGLNIFIHTGLIRAAKSSGELIGVMAHETGHIAGAHLSQLREKSTRAMLGSAIGALAGVAVMASGGRDAGAGMIAGSQQMAQRNLFSDIRVNEQSADHAALKYLDENEISATGMLDMFETMRRKEAGAITKVDPYTRTHPLHSERIATIRNHVEQSKIPPGQVPPGFEERHQRMVAKLAAFLEPYERTMTLYPPTDKSVAARYARAIAEFRRNNLPAAIAGIDGLIKEQPKDPFFYDTKGQILFESGKLPEAEAAYARANQLLPGNGLILTDYAKTLIATDDPVKMKKAVALLDQAKEVDDSNSGTWRQLAIVHGKQGRLGESYLALAEEAALGGNYKTVLQHVARARTQKDASDSLNLRLDDLQREAKSQLDKKKENNLF